jgi:hypothetical protein
MHYVIYYNIDHNDIAEILLKVALNTKMQILIQIRSGRGVQHYMIKFVSDLRHVGGFLRVLLFPPPINNFVYN